MKGKSLVSNKLISILNVFSFSIILFFIFVSLTFGQSRKFEHSKYIIKKSLPSIYISFVKLTEWTNSNDEKETLVWLRFHNNTIWKVILKARSGIGKDDVSLFYEIMDDDFKIIDSELCHVCSTIWSSSGKSILFAIPIVRLKQSFSMRISYNYEWEDYPYSDLQNEPQHFVYFKTRAFLKQKETNSR